MVFFIIKKYLQIHRSSLKNFFIYNVLLIRIIYLIIY